MVRMCKGASAVLVLGFLVSERAAWTWSKAVQETKLRGGGKRVVERLFTKAMLVGVSAGNRLKGLQHLSQGLTQRGLGLEGVSRTQRLGEHVVDTQGGPTAPLALGLEKVGCQGQTILQHMCFLSCLCWSHLSLLPTSHWCQPVLRLGLVCTQAPEHSERVPLSL